MEALKNCSPPPKVKSPSSQSKAAKMYTRLYNQDNTLSNKAPSKLITPSLNIDPSQISSKSQRNSTQSSHTTGARGKMVSFRTQPEGNLAPPPNDSQANLHSQPSTSQYSTSYWSIPPGQCSNSKKKIKMHQDEEARTQQKPLCTRPNQM